MGLLSNMKKLVARDWDNIQNAAVNGLREDVRFANKVDNAIGNTVVNAVVNGLREDVRFANKVDNTIDNVANAVGNTAVNGLREEIRFANKVDNAIGNAAGNAVVNGLREDVRFANKVDNNGKSMESEALNMMREIEKLIQKIKDYAKGTMGNYAIRMKQDATKPLINPKDITNEVKNNMKINKSTLLADNIEKTLKVQKKPMQTIDRNKVKNKNKDSSNEITFDKSKPNFENNPFENNPFMPPKGPRPPRPC